MLTEVEGNSILFTVYALFNTPSSLLFAGVFDKNLSDEVHFIIPFKLFLKFVGKSSVFAAPTICGMYDTGSSIEILLVTPNEKSADRKL